MRLHHHNWHLLTGGQLTRLFRDQLPGVTHLPGTELVNDLQALKAGTIEVLEDRTASTVYRLRETCKVYQCFAGNTLVFDDCVTYCSNVPTDNIKEIYEAKPPVHRIINKGDSIIIERLKTPRFTAVYSPQGPEKLHTLTWIHPEPPPAKVSKLLKNMGAFAAHNLKV